MKLLTILFLGFFMNLNAQDFFQRTYGGPGSEFGRGVIQTLDGGYACVGATNSYADGSSNVYLIKVDELGDYIWGRNLGEAGKIDWGMDIDEDSEGNIYVAGYTNDTENSDYDGLLLKLSGSGELIWKKTFGDDDWDFFETITIDNNDLLYVVGNTYRQNTQKGWILSFNSDGGNLWERFIEGSGNINITGITICPQNILGFVGYSENLITDNNSFISGSLSSDGELIWSVARPELGSPITGKCACNEQNKMFSTGSLLTETDRDFFIVLEDIQTGSLLSNQHLDTEVNVNMRGVDILTDGRTAFVGDGEFVYFDGVDGYGTIRSANGNYISSTFTIGFGFDETDRMFDCSSTSDGGYIAIGETNSYYGNYQLLLAKVASNGDATIENQDFLDLATPISIISAPEKTKLFPNPTKGALYIETNSRIRSYSIHSVEGKIVMKNESLKMNPDKIDMSGLNKGLYLIEILFENGSSLNRRIIKD